MKPKYAKNDKYSITLKPDEIDRIDALRTNPEFPQAYDRAVMIRICFLKGMKGFEAKP